MAIAPRPNGVRAAQYLRMSTDHQRYSIDNQVDAIRAYAEAKGYQLVRTYSDPGRSGLTLKGRPGLQRLLADIAAGEAPFDALLVYDVSRWGRFQEPDEAAAYEHHCRSRGVQIVYCAEPFDNGGGAFNALVKSLKRTMAAEYSRDLSRRVFRGQAKIAAMGYWPGSTPPYGYERWAVDERTGERSRLGPRQYKSIANYRTQLVPGPEEEVRLVRRAFRLMVVHGRTIPQIARTLDAEGWKTRKGRPWNPMTIRHMLRNEHYAGVMTYSPTAHNLMSGEGLLLPVRVVGAIEAIIDRKTFDSAQAFMAARRPTGFGWTDAEMLKGLARLAETHGRLSTKLIQADKTLPSYDTYRIRFGSAAKAFTLVGETSRYHYLWSEHRQQLKAIRTRIIGELRLGLDAVGVPTDCGAEAWSFRASSRSVAVFVKTPARRSRQPHYWEVRFGPVRADLMVGVRLEADYSTLIDLYVVPMAACVAPHVALGPRSNANRLGRRAADVDQAVGHLAAAISRPSWPH